jgi:hypothetical protein
MTFLTILFCFQSQNFSRHRSPLACKAYSACGADECFSHKTFPECFWSFLRSRYQISKTQNIPFFSYKFSQPWLSPPEKQFHFSRITFLANEKNVVCTILAHKKCGKCQSGKVMREKPPVLPLNIHSAAKSFLRTAKNILRNVIITQISIPIGFLHAMWSDEAYSFNSCRICRQDGETWRLCCALCNEYFAIV